MLLDLTATFDMHVDHEILLSCLEHWVGIKETALDINWIGFQSYLAQQTLS